MRGLGERGKRRSAKPRGAGERAPAREGSPASRALQEGEERLEELSANLADAMVYQIDSGPDGLLRRLTYISPVVERFHGLSPEAVLADPSLLYGQMLEEDRALLARTEAEAFASKTRLEAEVRVRLPSGEVRWRRFVSAPRLARGGSWLWDGIEQDVTERRRAEEALRESEAALRVAEEIARLGHWRYQPSTGEIWWSDVLFEIFGLERTGAPLTLEALLPRIHPDDRATFSAEVAGQRPHRTDYRIVLPDGVVRYIHEEVRTERDPQGNPVRISGTAQDVTERREAERRLLESERSYRTLFESATDGIVILDLDGKILDANPTAYERLGYTREELLSLDIRDIDSPDFATRVPERVRQLQERGTAMFESAHRRKDGSDIPVEVNSRLLDYAGRKVFLSVIRDITERKQAERALSEQRILLQQILDTASVAIFLVDKTGRITHANRRMAEMFAFPPDELIGCEYVQLVHPAEREIGRSKMLALLAAEIQSVDLERLYLRKDGREFWGHLAGRRFHDPSGTDLGLIGVISDISARRQTEEALKTSEARFRTIIESASAGILVADPQTRRFTYANPEVCRMLGYSAAELLGLDVAALHPPEELPRVAQTFAAGRGVQTVCLRRDGTTFPVDIRAVSIELDGRPCLVGFFTDMTERRLLESERLKAQKLESVGMLAGGIAHDFNNLLQGIFGYLSLAKLSLDDRARAAKMLDQAEKALHLATNLTSQLLTFARGGKPVRKLIALGPVLENAARLALSGSRSGYQLDLEEGLWPVEADEGQLGQVIQNIVLNADQAMPLGGSVVISARNLPASRAAAHPGLEARDHLEISISDQGVGIPAKYMDRIFDPYFTTKESGSGLGLATSYSIVTNHGGRIEVSSEAGTGTTFSVFLPAAPAASAGTGDVAAPRRARSGRVLVMDDEQTVRDVAVGLLRSLGFETDAAEHGEAALERYRRALAEGRRFDAVILDLTVRGGMGGAETMRRLLEVDPAVTAIVTSGYADSALLSSHREHGFRSALKKPFLLRDLERALDEALP